MKSSLTKPAGKHRPLAVLTITLAAAACSAMAGYLLGGAFAVRLAETRLQQYAASINADGEASAAELRTELAAVSASPHSSCSESEIRYLRALIFESEYVKDAGRIHDGQIVCSAALGRARQPQSLPSPDFTRNDGTEVYKNLNFYQSSGLTTMTLTLGDSFVVFIPMTRMHLEPAPMHFAETATDAPTQRTVQFLGEPLPAQVAMFTTDGMTRRGDGLYATSCSIRFFSCVTAYSTIPEILQSNHAKIFGGAALGGLLGVLCSLVLTLLLRHNKSVEQQLRRAIARDKLKVVYQPIVSLASGRITEAEALARWTDENGLVVGPDVFIRIAEERGFVREITRLVVRRVLRDFGQALRSHPDFHICINVTASDLSDAEFLPMLDRALKQAGVAAQSLTIEITEGSTVRHDAAIETIRRLRKRGHSVYIDDFGTGYSSLAYLHNLSVDAIKIDKAFTQAIGTEAVTVSILPQILAMAGVLNLGVVVEGVETTEQADYFASVAHPVLVQGWLFGHPAPAEQIQRLLAEDKKPSSAPPAGQSSKCSAQDEPQTLLPPARSERDLRHRLACALDSRRGVHEADYMAL